MDWKLDEWVFPVMLINLSFYHFLKFVRISISYIYYFFFLIIKEFYFAYFEPNFEACSHYHAIRRNRLINMLHCSNFLLKYIVQLKLILLLFLFGKNEILKGALSDCFICIPNLKFFNLCLFFILIFKLSRDSL